MAGKNVWCLIADAGGARTEYPVAASPTRIGRDGANDIELSGLEVSRFHAELFPGEKTLKIVDLGSDNGVLVDGLPAGKEAEVEEGQEIGIGLHRLRVERRREARGGRQDTLLLTADAVRHLRAASAGCGARRSRRRGGPHRPRRRRGGTRGSGGRRPRIRPASRRGNVGLRRRHRNARFFSSAARPIVIS
ncbi:MAG: FHA domain-containing protein [Deltaproteobacteria bacterium]|nr:FHA domain-containing protein [Deltaproteobacteria bacterium]